MEEWRTIKDYENYQVSNLGNVRNNLSGRLLKCRINHNGYLRIGLGGYKQQKWFFVHKLVYETFIGPIPKGMQVNHIDEDKTNNFIWVNPDGSVDLEKSNLNLMTPKENTNWGSGIRRGVRKRRKPVTQYIGNKPFFHSFQRLMPKERRVFLVEILINAARVSVQPQVGSNGVMHHSISHH